MSTRQIAEAAGVAEGTIFRVFATKEALIDAVLDDVFDVESPCDRLARIDPIAALERRLAEAVGVLQRRMRRVIALFHSMRVPRPGPAPAEPAEPQHRTTRSSTPRWPT